jgi:hypothetical protein
MPVIMLCGLRVEEMPLLTGNVFVDKAEEQVSGITLNGKVSLMVARTRSLITQICRSILGACLLAAAALSAMPAKASSCFRGTSLPSIRVCLAASKAMCSTCGLNVLRCLHKLSHLSINDVLGSGELEDVGDGFGIKLNLTTTLDASFHAGGQTTRISTCGHDGTHLSPKHKRQACSCRTDQPLIGCQEGSHCRVSFD